MLEPSGPCCVGVGLTSFGDVLRARFKTVVAATSMPNHFPFSTSAPYYSICFQTLTCQMLTLSWPIPAPIPKQQVAPPTPAN